MSDSYTFDHWAVWEVNFADRGGKRVIVGFNSATGRSRISTEITGWDAQHRTANTKSGSTYYLMGKPASDPNDNMEWKYWQMEKKISTALDVSDEYV